MNKNHLKFNLAEEMSNIDKDYLSFSKTMVFASDFKIGIYRRRIWKSRSIPRT